MHYRILIILLLLNVACENSPKKDSQSQLDSPSSQSSENIINSIGEVLSPEARKLVESWGEFEAIEAIMIEYYNISPVKALSNAQALSTATQQFKDSIRVEQFKNPDLKIRVNVLHNTALRLQDMHQIPKISDEEVKLEVSNLVKTFFVN